MYFGLIRVFEHALSVQMSHFLLRRGFLDALLGGLVGYLGLGELGAVWVHVGFTNLEKWNLFIFLRLYICVMRVTIII